MTSSRWPVYKGASFDLWTLHDDIFYGSAHSNKITKHLYEKRLRSSSNKRSVFSLADPDELKDKSTLHCYRARIAFRDVTNAIDSRTLIAVLLPPNVVVTDTAPVLIWPKGTARDEALLLGLLCSMVVDWYARRIVQLHMKFNHFNNIPIPDFNIDPDTGDPISLRVIEISGRLAAIDERFTEWATEVGVPVGSANDPEIKQALIEELDACVAHLYDLDEDDLACLYETFHLTTDYSARQAAVLKHFRRLAKS